MNTRIGEPLPIAHEIETNVEQKSKEKVMILLAMPFPTWVKIVSSHIPTSESGFYLINIQRLILKNCYIITLLGVTIVLSHDLANDCATLTFTTE